MRVTLAIGFGLLLAANGFLMLFDPAQWYAMVPGVPETGPFNPHFVRDVGVAYSVSGIGLAWCARNLDRALPVLIGIVLFNTGHAITHVADILEDRLPSSHWLIDTPGVFAPTAALIAAGVILARRAPDRL